MRPVKKRAITVYNGNDYDVLRTYLFSRIGAYCSYCEQPVANDSAVEHKIPKAAAQGFPRQATEWRNLLLACQSCNAAKWQTPSKQDVHGDARQDREEWYLEALKLWVWPDSTAAMRYQPAPSVDEIYRLIRFEHSPKTQDALATAGLVRKPWRTAMAPAWALAPQTKTWVLPNDNYITTQPNPVVLRQRVVATIAGLNLNLNNTDDPGYNNRRVDNRDDARGAALGALGQLETVYAGTPNPATDRVILTVKTIREAALATGFWSVWFWVFREALENPAAGTRWYGVSKANRQEILERTLLYYYPNEQGGNPAAPLFPGTDDSRLNLAAFT